MAKLTAAKKKAEPKGDFGLPEQRKYPMPDAAHARNAKARASQAENAGKLGATHRRPMSDVGLYVVTTRVCPTANAFIGQLITPDMPR